MSEDEALALILSAGISLFCGARWYGALFRIRHLGRRHAGPWLLLCFGPVLCMAGVHAVIVTAADPVVRGSYAYIALFDFAGACYLAAATFGMTCMGISARDDALENRNAAAAWAIFGMQAGTAACFAGSNVGVGPTIWTTLFPALISAGVLFSAGMLIATTTSLSDDIAIDRDTASGMRLAGFFMASGLVLGRAAAGDFASWSATLLDFLVVGWPVAGFAVAAIALQRSFRPTPHLLHPSSLVFGAIPAAALVALALGWWMLA